MACKTIKVKTHRRKGKKVKGYKKRIKVKKKLFFPPEEITEDDLKAERIESFEDMMERRKEKNARLLGLD